MALLTITTPRGAVVQRKTAGGKITAQLQWNPSFGRERTKQLRGVQAFVDSEVIRLMEPYTPHQSRLRKPPGYTIFHPGHPRHS